MTCIIMFGINWHILLYTLITIPRGTGTPAKPKMPNLNPETRADLEQKHYDGYKSVIDLHKDWPEVNINNPKDSCHVYLSSLFPQVDVTTTDCKLRNIHLHYKEIKDLEQNGLRSPIKLLTLECQLLYPVKSRKFLHFIRAFKVGCSYLVNRINKHSGYDFYIAAEVCIKDNFNSSAYNPDKINKEASAAKFKHNMKWQSLKEYDYPEVQLQHEKDHFKDYFVNQVDYAEWPEMMSITNKDNYCQELLKLICTKTDLSHVYSTVGIQILGYVAMKKNDGVLFNTAKVAEIICYIPQRVQHNYYRFIRTPHPSCVYLIKGIKSCREKRICKKICLNDPLTSMMYDHTKEQLQHERDHHEDYLINKVSYENWPEMMKIQNKNKYCQKLLKKVCKDRDMPLVDLKVGNQILHYELLEKTDNIELPTVMVTEILCRIPQLNDHICFHFIRAPQPNCVYLMKEKSTSSHSQYIFKRICYDDDNKVEEEEEEEVDNNNDNGSGNGKSPSTGVAVPDFISTNNILDVTDFPINDVYMELIK